jgi:hypothetical protein
MFLLKNSEAEEKLLKKMKVLRKRKEEKISFFLTQEEKISYFLVSEMEI